MIWSVLENHLAIVVACAPSVKVIALLVFPRLASSLGKVVSKVTPSNSRSRSRASAPLQFGTDDLESGTRKSDKLKPTPNSTPLPSPALTAGSGASRASRNFARWFKSPTSPTHLTSGDSIEGHGLVYVEDMRRSSKDVYLADIPKPEGKRDSGRAMSPIGGENDIRIEHTITVQDGSVKTRESDDDIQVMGRAV